jgi:prepilin-type N-terminal cleavage/methylation domain-containing protein/prepilin-type processing-associated H-X9-DG protein
MRRNTCNVGFTLVELLVVVSIVALLIGILIPTVGKARRVATKTACGANLASLGKALVGYHGDNAERYPQARYMPEPFLSIDTDPPIMPFLDPYLDRVQQVYRCPGDRDYVYALAGCSYVYNTALAGKTLDDTWFVRRHNVPPTDVPVSYDFDGNTYATFDGSVTAPWFHERRNLLFADGHVGNYQ